MGKVSPIQTRYAGCHFRSRLEARWAVFFDSLQIPWQYEPEGFDLGEAGAYLPDFLLYPNTEDSIWLEVKGRFPTDSEVRKAQALSAGTGIRSCIYFSSPDLPAPASLVELTFDQYTDRRENWKWDNEAGWQRSYPDGPAQWDIDLKPTAFVFCPESAHEAVSQFWWWTDCNYCGMVILKVEGQIGFCPAWDEIMPEGHTFDYPNFGHASPRLQAAYAAARSARFEFGATGR